MHQLIRVLAAAAVGTIPIPIYLLVTLIAGVKWDAILGEIALTAGPVVVLLATYAARETLTLLETRARYRMAGAK